MYNLIVLFLELAKREDELSAEQEMLSIEDNRATDLTEGESSK